MGLREDVRKETGDVVKTTILKPFAAKRSREVGQYSEGEVGC